MGYKKLSNEQELVLVEEYRQGASIKSLMGKYGFASKKSIADKVKKHYPNSYKEIVKQAQNNRKGYSYSLEKITSFFDAYFVGLMMTDGYIVNSTKVGIDLVDEDCIRFLSDTIGHKYKTYAPNIGSTGVQAMPKLNRHRLIISDKELVNNLVRFGIVPNKTLTLQPPKLLPEEEKYIPYIIRGIIDGDGCITPTSYGGAYFYIATKSQAFIEWIADVLTNRLYMIDISPFQTSNNMWKIETANQFNIQKLIALVYDKPFGMSRKYYEIRKTFRDFNSISLLEE